MPCPVDASFSDWASINTIGVIHRRREVEARLRNQPKRSLLACRVRCVISPIDCAATEHGEPTASLLDVTFKEDSSRILLAPAQNFFGISKLALSDFAAGHFGKRLVSGKRKRCGWDNQALSKVLAVFLPINVRFALVVPSAHRAHSGYQAELTFWFQSWRFRRSIAKSSKNS